MTDKIKKGVFGINEYKDMLLKDASLSANVFMPHWQISSTTANGMNGNEMICHIQYIVDGLMEVYYRYAGLWNDISGFDSLITSVCTNVNDFAQIEVKVKDIMVFISCTVVVSFFGGGNWTTWRKTLTCYESLTNFIT